MNESQPNPELEPVDTVQDLTDEQGQRVMVGLQIKVQGGPCRPEPGLFHSEHVGHFCAVRPVTSMNPNNLTYLGIYLGELPKGIRGAVDLAGSSITFGYSYGNPAIFVPALQKTVMGYESWWSVLEKPEDMQKITDQTIQDQWYVKAARAMFEDQHARDEQAEQAEQAATPTEADA